MVIKTKKNGFSIAEVLISMLIMSVFFLATSKVMTTKQKPEVQENPHGFYECYLANGSLRQGLSVGTSRSRVREAVNSCEFTPPQGLAFVIIYAMQDRNHIYKSIEPQFNSPIDSISSVALADFHKLLGNPEDNNLRADDLKHYLDLAYPQSRLRNVLGSESYNGPALFIGW